jgi:TonB family protein
MMTKATIQNPCPKGWDSMKIGLQSRFCDNCKKDVIDFTNKDRQQILEYLLSNFNKKVCGHIYPSQLDFSQSDFLVTINSLAKQSNNTNLAFYLLTIGSLILAGCNNDLEKSNNSLLDSTTVLTSIDSNTTVNLNHAYKDTQKQGVEPPEIPMEGEICVIPDISSSQCEPYTSVEIMPEFKGGIDSLMSFIKQNLNYPDWEKKNKIEGKVFVSFIVDKNGKIKDTEILRTVEGAKNFDNEVLRVVNSMPDWTPGRQDGNNVDVKYNLPINFKL